MWWDGHSISSYGFILAIYASFSLYNNILSTILSPILLNLSSTGSHLNSAISSLWITEQWFNHENDIRYWYSNCKRSNLFILYYVNSRDIHVIDMYNWIPNFNLSTKIRNTQSILNDKWYKLDQLSDSSVFNSTDVTLTQGW